MKIARTRVWTGKNQQEAPLLRDGRKDVLAVLGADIAVAGGQAPHIVARNDARERSEAKVRPGYVP